MPYNTKITEQNPTLVIIMVDQSGSMNEKYGGESKNWKTKAEIVAEATNQLIMDLMARCRQGAVHKRYFDIAAIGYSGAGVYPLLHQSRYTLSPTEMASVVKREEKQMRKVRHPNGSMITQYSSHRVWIEPQGEGQTPMYAALERAIEVLGQWRQKQAKSDAFPPIIINITDGEPTDADGPKILGARDRIRAMGTTDGEPLIFNFHISGLQKQGVMFPLSAGEVPRDGGLLYELSSDLPPMYNEQIAVLRADVDARDKVYRAFSYNLPTADFIKALSIGTATTRQISR